MSDVKNTAQKIDERTQAPRAARISFDGPRWGSRPTAPRLVSFSWGAVSPAPSRR